MLSFCFFFSIQTEFLTLCHWAVIMWLNTCDEFSFLIKKKKKVPSIGSIYKEHECFSRIVINEIKLVYFQGWLCVEIERLQHIYF